MIYPIVAYGDPVLKKVGEDIDKNYPGIEQLIEDMYETMYASHGVGLAAPQIGKSIRLFIIDASPFADEHPELEGYKKTFINAEILDEKGEEWVFNEGCLSIPNVREDVKRHPIVKMKYLDENFNEHVEVFTGIPARIIQHEYDHIDGVLFVDHISALRKRMIKAKLTNIAKGNVSVDYKMKFPLLKKG